jgi:hypothetical protein
MTPLMYGLFSLHGSPQERGEAPARGLENEIIAGWIVCVAIFHILL